MDVSVCVGVHIKVWSCSTLVPIGELSLENHICAPEKISQFVVSLAYSERVNIDLYWNEKLVVQERRIPYSDIESRINDILLAFQRGLDESHLCPSCNSVMIYFCKDDSEITLFIPESKIKVKAKGLYEARCADCGTVNLRFGSLLQLETL